MKKIIIIVSAVLAVLIAASAALILTDTVTVGKSSRDGSLWIGSSNYAKAGQIYLVGEAHAKEAILAEELRIWQDLYHNEGMRHFFEEAPYYSAEFINLWMKSDDNEYLDLVFEDTKGTLSHSDYVYTFYLKIKETCPETVFHGTDVGHQYNTTGAKYLRYLEENGMKDSENYRLAEEAIEQGKQYYTGNNGEKDHEYREAMMAANFMREYDKLGGLSIFGVYGSNHTNYPVIRGENTPSMATAIVRTYGNDMVEVNNLSLKYNNGELTGKLQ